MNIQQRGAKRNKSQYLGGFKPTTSWVFTLPRCKKRCPCLEIWSLLHWLKVNLLLHHFRSLSGQSYDPVTRPKISTFINWTIISRKLSLQNLAAKEILAKIFSRTTIFLFHLFFLAAKFFSSSSWERPDYADSSSAHNRWIKPIVEWLEFTKSL